MPFKSKKQRRWMWANEPEMAKKWSDEEKQAKRKEGKTLKITKSRLQEIIQEELSSLSEQGLSSDPRTEAESESENMALVKDVIMLGLEAYTSGKLSKEDEREYGHAVQDILERNVPATQSISDLVREIELEGSRQGTDSGPLAGTPLSMFDEEVEAIIERLGYAPGKIGAPSSQDVAGIALDKIDHVFIDRVKTEISDDDVRTRAEGIAQDLGFIRKSHED